MFARLSHNLGIPWRRQIKNFLEGEIAPYDTEMGDGSDPDVEDTSLSSAFSITPIDSMAELIPEFRPLHIPPFDIAGLNITSSTPRTTSNRHPWTILSEMTRQDVVLNSHSIRQEVPVHRPSEIDIWPLPTIEETTRQRLQSDQYVRGNVAVPSAYEEASNRPALAPTQESRLNSHHSFTEGQTYRDENDLTHDPPPPYQASNPNSLANWIPNAAPTCFPVFASNFTPNPGPSSPTLNSGPIAHNTAFNDAFETAPEFPMDTTSDIALRTAYNTETNTLRASEYPHITQSPHIASQPSARVATGRIGESMARCVEGIGKTAKDVPRVMKDMRQLHRARRAKAKMSWLERHAFVARDGSLVYAAEM